MKRNGTVVLVPKIELICTAHRLSNKPMEKIACISISRMRAKKALIFGRLEKEQ